MTPYAWRKRWEKKLGFVKPHARAVAAMVAGDGWEEVADRALEWALAHASWTPAVPAIRR